MLTMARLILGIVIPFFILSESLGSRILAMILFFIAAFTDLFDGKISRKMNLVTRFGKIMDPISDKVLNLGVFFVFAYLGLFPFWIFWIILIREVTVTLARLYLLMDNKIIAAEMAGKIKTTIQFIALFTIYMRLMLIDHFNVDQSIIIMTEYLMYGFLALTLILTIYSGLSFFRKNIKKFK